MSGTAEQLRGMVAAATAGPWRMIPHVSRAGMFAGADSYVRAADDKTVATGVRTDGCAALIALAPDAVALLADCIDALAGLMEIAETAMPDSYFHSDSRTEAARDVLSRAARLVAPEPAA